MYHSPNLPNKPQEHSPDGDDLLPGVYTLASGWVNEAVLASFRDSAGSEADLEGWFASPWVQAYAQVREYKGGCCPILTCFCIYYIL